MRRDERRRARLALAGLVAAGVAACGSTSGAPSTTVAPMSVAGGHAEIGQLAITRAYIPDPATPSIAAAYFTVTNAGPADRLVSITTPGFASAQLNRYDTHPDGSESMVAVPSGAVVPAHGQLVLTPGSYHVMLMKPHHALKRGATAQLILTFARAGAISMVVPIVADTGLPTESTAGNMPGMNMSGGTM